MPPKKPSYVPISDRSGLSTGYKTLSKRLGGYRPLSTRGLSHLAGSVGSHGQDALSAAFDLIKKEEGLRTEAYQDQTGKWTIGFGNTMINGRPVRPGDRITSTQALQMMKDSVIKNYTTFAGRIKRQLSPQQFAALTSFEYNLGSGIWNDESGGKILSLIEAGRAREAGQLMQSYNKSKNPATRQLEINPVLTNRRKREAQMLATIAQPSKDDEDAVPQYIHRGYTPMAEREASTMRV